MRLFVYDEDGVTHLLRGVPEAWGEASVCTSAAGGFRVRLDLKAGRLVRLDVEARNPAPGKSIRLRGRKGLFSAVRPVPGSTRLIPGEETDDLTVCTERKGPVILIDPPRAGLPGSGDPRA